MQLMLPGLACHYYGSNALFRISYLRCVLDNAPSPIVTTSNKAVSCCSQRRFKTSFLHGTLCVAPRDLCLRCFQSMHTRLAYGSRGSQFDPQKHNKIPRHTNSDYSSVKRWLRGRSTLEFKTLSNTAAISNDCIMCSSISALNPACERLNYCTN